MSISSAGFSVEPAFGVGVTDLDGQSLAGAHDVHRTHRIAGDRVFHAGEQHAQPHRQIRIHDRLRKAEHDRRAGHVLLHKPHAGCGLQIETAAVEAHPFADQRHPRRRRLPPNDVHKVRRTHARTTHHVYRRIILSEELIADGDAVARARLLRDAHRFVRKLFRAEVTGRRVGKIASEEYCPGQPLDAATVGPLGPSESSVRPCVRAAA
jgi:hypothetical protein